MKYNGDFLCGIFFTKQTQKALRNRLTEKVMCSIFGVFDIKTDAVELRKKALELSRLMRHRGPDWSGIYASDNAILAHERLSIVDVNAGAQPLYNVKKTHILAVNGEIYNHQALRAEYGDRYQFQTGSDCEVILALYQEKGPEFLDDLQGMFAFALYDSEQDAYDQRGEEHTQQHQGQAGMLQFCGHGSRAGLGVLCRRNGAGGQSLRSSTDQGPKRHRRSSPKPSAR